MAKYTGPRCRLCRREGEKLFLKGSRCYSDKCSFDRRTFAPGVAGRSNRFGKLTEYALRLREKQKLRRTYGMMEKQFKRFFKLAVKMKGNTGENFLQLLERRLDNIVLKLGIAPSIYAARQVVNHGHIQVNGKKVDIPSYLVKKSDVINVKEGSKYAKLAKYFIEERQSILPEWLSLDAERLQGAVLELPVRDQIVIPVKEQLIIEFYSK
ncbi:MAG: 30S ribosomal protein S4 [Candidatus Coatesbacteria bacterium]|nr:30S ribosomal protein S4 [Candidatus Coatesbacteria bacterium]